jgi:hypothetical protein
MVSECFRVAGPILPWRVLALDIEIKLVRARPPPFSTKAKANRADHFLGLALFWLTDDDGWKMIGDK